MCPADLSAVADGWSFVHRDEWERHILQVNAWVSKPIKYDDIFGVQTTKTVVRSKEDWAEFKDKYFKGRHG